MAYAISESDPKKIEVFANGEEAPDGDTEEIIRDLAEVTERLLEDEQGSEELVRATMLGMNPNLNDQSVIELFHQGEPKRVVEAAPYLANALG